MPATIAAIASCLGPTARRFDIDILDSCDSTNAVLLARAEAGAPSGSVVITREQTAGRGRRGRQWIASPGDSLAFSLLWRFAPGTAPAGLSLAVGLAVAKAMARVGADDTALKWPNDILRDGRKLGGILIELVPGTPHAAVIGIGLNLHLPAAMPVELRELSAALCEPDATADENTLYAILLGELLTVLEAFAASGFAPMRDEWMARNAYADASVTLLSDFGAPRSGICRGADTDGALLFEADGRVERILSGEVSLRPA
jgi:BirA family biotin operon repressor/biotin-[acetyl-CoA-carboxylase] ligase